MEVIVGILYVLSVISAIVGGIGLLIGEHCPRKYRGPAKGVFILGLSTFVGLLAFTNLLSIWVSYLWHDQLGYSEVYVKALFTEMRLFGIFGGIAGVIVSIASRQSFSDEWLVTAAERYKKQSGGYNNRTGLQSANSVLRTRWLLRWAASLLVFFGGGIYGASCWQDYLLWQNGAQVNAVDTVFAKDIGFHLFSLPFLSDLSLFAFFTALAATVLFVVIELIVSCLAGDYSSMAPLYDEDREVLFYSILKRGVRLVALTLVALVVMLWLGRYEMLHETDGRIAGPSYMAIHFWLPMRWGWIILLTLLAATMLLGTLAPRAFKRPWPYIAGIATFALFMIVGYGVTLPVMHSRLNASELDLQTPYLTQNVEATRFAYGINKVDVRDYDPREHMTLEDLQKSPQTLDNVRLWDYRALALSYNQLQELRQYYEFPDVDIDRYTVNGHYREVMLASRELDLSRVQNADSFNNQHLIYTHGYGLVMNQANEVTAQHEPRFLISDVPPHSSVPELKLTRPEIYFGELTSSHVYVNSKMEEFSYPEGEKNAYTHYSGTGGVPLGTGLRRLAFAWNFDGFKVLFSEYLTPETRVMWTRNVKDRIQRIAPFLSIDEDPYKVLREDGSMVYIVDAYTTTSAWPYSEHLKNGINYIRASVKIVVNAYDGSTTFYVMDDTCPVLQTWRAIYPSLFTPGSQMPADIRRHLRYPGDLLDVQSHIYGNYHMTDLKVFFTREDRWEVATEKFYDKEQVVEPYYLMAKLPGETREEFMLMVPFTPFGKKNAAGWMAGRSDGDNYGHLLVYRYPKQRIIRGPLQVETAIEQDPMMSQNLTLWSSGGKQVIRGNMLTIPIEGGLLYCEPIFLRTGGDQAMPQLAKVVCSLGDRTVWGNTFGEALANLFNGSSTANPLGPTNQSGVEGAASIHDAALDLDAYLQLMGEGKPTEAGQRLERARQTLRNLDKQGSGSH